MADDKCVSPAKGIILSEQAAPAAAQPSWERVEGNRMIARVGKPAPDFELGAFYQGGFKNIKLSDYQGKWIVVCFYPGDFTFV